MMPNSSSSPTVAKKPPTKSEGTEAGPCPVAGDLQQVGSQVEGENRGDRRQSPAVAPGRRAGLASGDWFPRPEERFGPSARRTSGTITRVARARIELLVSRGASGRGSSRRQHPGHESDRSRDQTQGHVGERAGDVLHQVAGREERERNRQQRREGRGDQGQKDGLDDLFERVAGGRREAGAADRFAAHGSQGLRVLVGPVGKADLGDEVAIGVRSERRPGAGRPRRKGPGRAGSADSARIRSPRR